MMRKFWQLTVKDSFCAAHALRHYEGKCERLHGHNYQVKLVVEGETLHQKTQLLMDFKELKLLLKQSLETMDHRLLNEVSPFDTINPSAENIAQFVWQNIAPHLPEQVRLHSVSVAEKEGQTATYMECTQ